MRDLLLKSSRLAIFLLFTTCSLIGVPFGEKNFSKTENGVTTTFSIGHPIPSSLFMFLLLFWCWSVVTFLGRELAVTSESELITIKRLFLGILVTFIPCSIWGYFEAEFIFESLPFFVFYSIVMANIIGLMYYFFWRCNSVISAALNLQGRTTRAVPVFFEVMFFPIRLFKYQPFIKNIYAEHVNNTEQ